MTTLVGIVAGKGKKGVILGSDLSITRVQWNPRGDIAYKQVTKAEGQKIYVDEKRQVALCMAGIWDLSYKNFRDSILSGEIDIKKVIKKGHFNELSKLNHRRWNGKVPIGDAVNSLLIATRFGEPKLYTCWPLGRVEEKVYTAIGSGSEYVLKYITNQDASIPRGITLSDGVDLVNSSLEKASEDIYTIGVDLVVVTSMGIKEFGGEIKDSIDQAKQRTIERIKRKVTQKSR